MSKLGSVVLFFTAGDMFIQRCLLSVDSLRSGYYCEGRRVGKSKDISSKLLETPPNPLKL